MNAGKPLLHLSARLPRHWLGLVAMCALSGRAAVTVDLEHVRPGLVFEGVGAVSAGASSRLLPDYPEQQRNEVLDFLFKPDYGAGFQHLKVEIGGEVNSTDGIELTHSRFRGDHNYTRGYEWWLMEEAHRRNPDLVLDCLAWGAPGWIGNGKYFSQDMADYVADFLAGAKSAHHLDIAWTGIWNETTHDPKWIKLLRQTLDRAGLNNVGIVAADDYAADGWKIVQEMQQDPELRAAVARVGVHYRDSKSPAAAKTLGCPLWSSEDGPWRGDWEGARRLARTINRNYIVGRFTKTEIWSPVTAYYDTLPLPGSGVMRAVEPWSGHYEVQPATWAVAHTTQFARPGWHYLDEACQLFPGGSVVALASPGDQDFSAIVETMDATNELAVEFNPGTWRDRAIHIWQSSGREQFRHVRDLAPGTGIFQLPAEPHCIYSVTTTTGQQKGGATPPPSARLPLPYEDDFSGVNPGTGPRLFSDQAGVFEVQPRDDGPGQCLSQVLRQTGIEWHSHRQSEPETVIGDPRWTDYCVSVDAAPAPGGYVMVCGRVDMVPQSEELPGAYVFQVKADGNWSLRVLRSLKGKQPWENHTDGKTAGALASGRVNLVGSTWHRIELTLNGERIVPQLDGKVLAEVKDSMHAHGQVGLGCGWSGARFANFSVRPAPAAAENSPATKQ